MSYYKMTLAGISGLLMNRFHEAAQASVPGGTNKHSSSVKGKDGGLPRAIAELKVHKTPEGAPCLPSTMLFACLVNAGSLIKVGRKQLSTKESSLVPAGIQIVEDHSLITPEAWEVDSRPVVNPSTKGRMMCHRPRFDKWAVTFTLVVDDEMFGEDIIRELVDAAGKKIGLGDYRPQKRGLYGRFVVTNWEKASE